MRKSVKKIKSASKAKEQRRKLSIRKKVVGTADRPRICATKSNKNLFVQVIDDVRMPLQQIKPANVKFGVIGLIGGLFGSLILIIGIFLGKDFLRKQKEEHNSSHS